MEKEFETEDKWFAFRTISFRKQDRNEVKKRSLTYCFSEKEIFCKQSNVFIYNQLKVRTPFRSTIQRRRIETSLP